MSVTDITLAGVPYLSGADMLMPTFGFQSDTGLPAVDGPFCIEASDQYIAGVVSEDAYIAGAVTSDQYVAGAVESDHCA